MTTSRHVLLLCWRDTDHPQGGGSERYLERVGAELVARGHDVTLLTARYPGSTAREDRAGVRVIRAGGRLGVYPRALATIVAARFGRGPLGAYVPDVVVDTQNGIPFFASMVTAAPTIILVHHCHREQWPVAGRLLGRLGWFLESWVSPRVHRRNRYVTVSAPSAADLVDLGVDRDRITVIHNGIDPLPDGREDAAHTAATSAQLCVLSRLVPHKQIEDALAVVADLRRTCPDVHLDVIGDGWWAQELRNRTAELGIVDAVTFHGHVSESRKHHLLARANVHLMPSRKEGWGLAVMEAAQHGVPTIGYRSSSGLIESIDHDRTGVLVDSVGEMTSATRKLIDDPVAAKRLGEAAQQKAAEYSWASTADGFSAVIGDVTAEPRR